MAAVSKAESHWRGGLADGQGRIHVASGAFDDFEVTWAARAEREHGKTSPEELLAAAHAACFSMALSHALGQEGHTPQELDVSAEVSFQPGEGITDIELNVRGRVDGLDPEAFRKAAEGAKAGCPVSKALAGARITLGSAELAG
ncbi:MAG TPA: OsmC family peroxiredoxin [Candidatus Dormibacteraeota bacterium]